MSLSALETLRIRYSALATVLTKNGMKPFNDLNSIETWFHGDEVPACAGQCVYQVELPISLSLASFEHIL